jgi:photosystem II stability/assembly factor-like uncharacterized protein
MKYIAIIIILLAGLSYSPAFGQLFWRSSHPPLKRNHQYVYESLAARGQEILVAATDYNPDTSTWSLTFFRSDDAGYHWEELQSGLPGVRQSWRYGYNIRSMQFIDDQHILAVSDSGYLIRTTNGGQSWLADRIVDGGNVNAMHFADAKEGIVVSGSVPYIHFTTNGGDTWQGVDIKMAGWGGSGQAFGGGRFSVFSYGYGSLYHTTDYWRSFDSTLPLAPQSDLIHVPIRCSWRSTDSVFAFGATYSTDATPTRSPFLAHTSTGGLSWDTIELPLKQLKAVQQLTDVRRDTILIAGLGAAEFAFSFDKGKSWSADSLITDTSFVIGVCRQMLMLSDGRPIALWEGGSVPGQDVGIFVGEWAKADVEIYEYYIRSTLFYPNPATSQLNVQSVVGGSSISVRDVLGREVAHALLDGAAKGQIDVSGLTRGFYFLTMKTGALNLPIGKLAVVDP